MRQRECRALLGHFEPDFPRIRRDFPQIRKIKVFSPFLLSFSLLFSRLPLSCHLSLPSSRGCSATCSGTRKVRKRGRTDSGYCELLGQRESEQGSGGGSPECAAVRKHRRFSEASSSGSRRGSDTVTLGETLLGAPFLERARASPPGAS